MKLYPPILVCLALIAGAAADGCFAQSTLSQNQSATDGNAPQISAVAVPDPAPPSSVSAGKTREQVLRELEDFQKSGQAAQLQDLYRGGN